MDGMYATSKRKKNYSETGQDIVYYKRRKERKDAVFVFEREKKTREKPS